MVGELADHKRDVGAIEGAGRNDAMVGAQAPRRSKLRPRRGEEKERRLRAAFGKRSHETS
jgi:hypothetical protein